MTINSSIIIGYFLVIFGIFFFINSSLKSRFRLIITWEGIVFVLMMVLFVTILGLKMNILRESGSVIEPELVAPCYLTSGGTEAIERGLNLADVRTTLDNCMLEKRCPTAEDNMNSMFMTKTHDFIFSSENQSEAIDWLRKNSIALSDMANWRGRYLHHYNTIMFPFREIIDGNLSYLLNSQYGLGSLLPLFIIKNRPFCVYPLLGLIVLMLFCACVLYKNSSSRDGLIISALFAIIAATCDVSALRISPGFSFFRYLPIMALIYISQKHLDKPKISLLIPAIIAALLNSLQFNILALLIFSTVLVAMFIEKRIDTKVFTFHAVLLSVILMQLYCGSLSSNAFVAELFGSVGEGQQSILYTCFIILFPLLAILLKFLENSERIAFTRSEILAYISYGALATYTISFANSPQHYSGFLQMACFSIFLIIKSHEKSIIRVLLLIVLFVIPSAFCNYLQITKDFNITKAGFYNYFEKIGTRLYFRTPTNVSAIKDEYFNLINKYAKNSKIYFLSKDKIYIENYLEKNMEPKSYDVFTNFIKIKPIKLLPILTAERVDYVVLDSPVHRSNSSHFLNMEKNDLPPGEFIRHAEILSNFDLLAEMIKPNLIQCSDRYCIYGVIK